MSLGKKFEEKFDGLDNKFDWLEKKVDGLVTKEKFDVDGVEEKFDGLVKTVDGVKKTLTSLDRRTGILVEEKARSMAKNQFGDDFSL